MKKLFTKKMVVNNIWSIVKMGQLQIIIIDLLFNFKLFNLFLVKLLNIMSIDKNRIMHTFYKKIQKMNNIHLQIFFGGSI